jgi:ubiquinone/menaquinone biosynthesis C-methylase UbiE
MNQAVYNRIGQTYDTTRRADPGIVARLVAHLQITSNGIILDIGCGTGNYTVALHEQGISITGIDVSETMLERARLKTAPITWHHGSALALPFADNSFGGALFMLSTHHMNPLQLALNEAYRIIDKGNLVIFTATPTQMTHYWLNHYFPKMMVEGPTYMTEYEVLAAMLQEAGFMQVTCEPFFVTNDLQDWFLQSGKYRPEVYLDPLVRAGISSFPLAEDTAEIEHGLAALAHDIESGVIQEIIESYESDAGDYLFIRATK